ncbi:multidrug efflux SMR transporter [Sandaracinobacter neustonicus]|uniref:Guanidinium exporter n=1 Tax=Sandaracinobacter neustonicus TaxID=1715348 RepID=A0A501XJY0_9SPHN|nr:multidrug efflux SMR transporter [Sandaracinobacter neustonicus]TPE60477.1 multidrug efflux SMR transporter [Sandaracinobacter neustonicus]
MGWLLLLAAGLFEVGFTTCMRMSDGFRHIGWTSGFLASATLSFILLERAQRSIPLGTAYAVWVGIGAAGTALVGMWLFREPVETMRLILLAVLVGAIIGLKLVSPV